MTTITEKRRLIRADLVAELEESAAAARDYIRSPLRLSDDSAEAERRAGIVCRLDAALSRIGGQSA